MKRLRTFKSIGNFFSNFFRKVSGSGLTDAEREANQWTASREDLAWQREMDAANTAINELRLEAG